MNKSILIDTFTNPLCNTSGAGGVAIIEQYSEFVSTQPRQCIGTTHTLTQQLRNLKQELITHGVPTGIIDKLKLIQINHHQCTALPRWLILSARLELCFELRTIK